MNIIIGSAISQSSTINKIDYHQPISCQPCKNQTPSSTNPSLSPKKIPKFPSFRVKKQPSLLILTRARVFHQSSHVPLSLACALFFFSLYTHITSPPGELPSAKCAGRSFTVLPFVIYARVSLSSPAWNNNASVARS